MRNGNIVLPIEGMQRQIHGYGGLPYQRIQKTQPLTQMVITKYLQSRLTNSSVGHTTSNSCKSFSIATCSRLFRHPCNNSTTTKPETQISSSPKAVSHWTAGGYWRRKSIKISLSNMIIIDYHRRVADFVGAIDVHIQHCLQYRCGLSTSRGDLNQGVNGR